MSASSAVGDKGIYTSKSLSTLVTNPEHGMSGWRMSHAGELEEMTYSINRDLGENGWVTVESHKCRVIARSKHLSEYFKAHPEELARRISQKRLMKKFDYSPTLTWH